MNIAKNGDNVKVHYTGKFANGKQFDSSDGREPLEFTVGSQQVIAGFDNAVLGMKVGEKKTVAFPPEEGYGKHMDEMIFEVANENFPEDFKPEIGMPLEMVNHQGETRVVSVSEITETGVMLDANHPLAGKHLTFDIELLEIK
ncbi:MAG: peptidylprolyl isomerase [bacterium]